MIVKQFFPKDLKNYEINTGNSVIKLFNEFDIHNLLDLISLGNGCCSKKVAGTILDNYLMQSEDNSLITALQDIRKCLLGENSSDTNDMQEGIDISKYKNVTELYTYFCFQLMSVGIGWSEFWEMSTTEIYSAFNSINVKTRNEINRELALNHSLAGMIAMAMVGKLDREAPQIREEQVNRIIQTEEFGEIDLETYNTIMALKAMKINVK